MKKRLMAVAVLMGLLLLLAAWDTDKAAGTVGGFEIMNSTASVTFGGQKPTHVSIARSNGTDLGTLVLHSNFFKNSDNSDTLSIGGNVYEFNSRLGLDSITVLTIGASNTFNVDWSN